MSIEYALKPSLTLALRSLAGFGKLEKGTRTPPPTSLPNSATGSIGEYTTGGIGEVGGTNLRSFDEQASSSGEVIRFL